MCNWNIKEMKLTLTNLINSKIKYKILLKSLEPFQAKQINTLQSLKLFVKNIGLHLSDVNLELKGKYINFI